MPKTLTITVILAIFVSIFLGFSIKTSRVVLMPVQPRERMHFLDSGKDFVGRSITTGQKIYWKVNCLWKNRVYPLLKTLSERERGMIKVEFQKEKEEMRKDLQEKIFTILSSCWNGFKRWLGV